MGILLWEDQFTACVSQLLRTELSSLSTIETFTMGKHELIENQGCTLEAAWQQQIRYTRLRYALRKINMQSIDLCVLCVFVGGGSLTVRFSCLYGFYKCLQYRPLISTIAEVHNTIVAYTIVCWPSLARSNIFRVILHKKQHQVQPARDWTSLIVLRAQTSE